MQAQSEALKRKYVTTNQKEKWMHDGMDVDDHEHRQQKSDIFNETPAIYNQA